MYVNSRKSSNVWSQDAMLRDLTKLTMTKQRYRVVDSYFVTSGKMFNKISGTTLRQLEANQTLAQMIETYNNSLFVRVRSLGNTR